MNQKNLVNVFFLAKSAVLVNVLLNSTNLAKGYFSVKNALRSKDNGLEL
jgi:hypothetical protein